MIDGADGGIVRVGGDVGDEGLVDLEDVEGKALQIGQAGIAGAEVVDGEGDAHGLELVQRARRLLDVLHDERLGDFQFQVARRQAGFVQGGGDDLRQVGQAELARREVDRHAQVGVDGFHPLLGLAAGLQQHPFADRHDQAGFLGDGDELGRRDQAEFGMVPAQQRLEAADGAAAAEVDLRLVVQDELVALQRAAQGVFQLSCRPAAAFMSAA